MLCRRFLRFTAGLALVAFPLAYAPCAKSQTQPDSPADEPRLTDLVRQLQKEILALQQSVADLQNEAAQYRAETRELRAQVAAAHSRQESSSAQQGQPNAVTGQGKAEAETAEATRDQRLSKAEEDIQLLSSKVDEQYQTKVESASKYRVRLFGIVLFNMFSNRGSVDNLDVPTLAVARTPFDSAGAFGGTLRQSSLGLEVFGPRLAGARTRGDIQFDFFGGFPEADNGTSFGLARLRTGTMRMDWANTSVVAGQDTLFFAPLAPTSLASLAIPALAYAGNLWGWTPQVRVEQRKELSDKSNILFQAGILDPLTGEPPAFQYLRTPNAGERSGQPAYAARIAWTHEAFGKPLTIGGGGYYSPQNWGFHRLVHGWAATTDLTLPLTHWFSVTGELYRGQAIGGFGGAVGQTVVFSGYLTNPATDVYGLDGAGGWAQLKFMPTAKLEFNGAFGQDYSLPQSFLGSSIENNYGTAPLLRNRVAFANLIARPRSDLVLSVEYRHIRTFSFPAGSEVAHQINVSTGVLF
jgi:hypothetical protein